MNDQKTALFIGVDGGGTKCRVRIRNQNGVICSDADGGPANIYSDFHAAIAEIKKTLNHALAKLNPKGRLSMMAHPRPKSHKRASHKRTGPKARQIAKRTTPTARLE